MNLMNITLKQIIKDIILCNLYSYKLKIICDVGMQVGTFREGEVMTGWGHEGNLGGGDVPFLIVVVVSDMGMFPLRKVAELNNYDLYASLYEHYS